MTFREWATNFYRFSDDLLYSLGVTHDQLNAFKEFDGKYSAKVAPRAPSPAELSCAWELEHPSDKPMGLMTVDQFKAVTGA